MKTPLLITCTCMVFSNLLHAQVTVKQVKDINVGYGDSRPNSFAIANNRLFFIASDGVNFNKLWVTDGDEASTVMLGPASGGTNSISSLVALKNKVYFSFNDNINGEEIWVSDGTVAGTTILKDIYAGATGSFPLNLTVNNNKLFFIANNADGDKRLYASDGTAAGTIVVKDGYTSNFNGVPTFVTLNNDILFSSDDGSGSGYGLWKTDGTPGGTGIVVSGLVAGNSAGNSVVLNNKVYFSASDNDHGLELWYSNGTTAGTKMVKNISPDPGGGVYGNSSPQGFCVYNNKVYFSATDGTHGQELWVTDGTAAGTNMVKDVLPGENGSLPYHSIVYNNLLYFITWQQQELWVSDGTEAGTSMVATLNPYSQFGAKWNNTLYLWSGTQTQVYQSDGTTAGTVLAKASNTVNPINYLSPDYYFREYKGDLYFSGSIYQVSNGYELCKLTTGALPLTLVTFEGQVQKDNDVLTWQTATEINTARFEVQQSANGSNFTTAATIAAAGNSSTLINYSYQQKRTVNPGGYYRLKMVDKDGAFTYSNIIKLARSNSGMLAAFYDNARKQIIVQNTTSEVCNWQLYTSGGALVKKGISTSGSIIIPAYGMAAGIYILRCDSKNYNGRFTLPVF